MKPLRTFIGALSISVAAAVFAANPVRAAIGAPGSSGSGTVSDSWESRRPDSQKELRYLSKNLRLSRGQRTVVGSILQERAREMRLLQDVESLSPEFRDTLAAKVIQDSNAQIETLLRRKQKRKFNKELAKDAISRQPTA